MVARFEELIVWRRARELAVAVYRVTAAPSFGRDAALQGQMRRAAVSVMSNVAEGFERHTRAEFARFLSIARGSAGELRSQLYLAADLGYLAPAEAEPLLASTREITRLIIGLRKSLGA